MSSCVHLLTAGSACARNWNSRHKAGRLSAVRGLAVGEAPLDVLDVQVSCHMCTLERLSQVSLCRSEIKLLVGPGNPLIVAAVGRYKIRAHRVFFPPYVSQIRKQEKKKYPDGRMTGGIAVCLQTSSEQMPESHEAGEGYTECVLLVSRHCYCDVGFWKKKKMVPNTIQYNTIVFVAFFVLFF